MASGISFGGLFSGLDTENIISQLIQIERKPIQLLQNRKIKLDAEKNELTNINNKMIGLKSSLDAFLTGQILQNSASSKDESILTASADVSASEGVYNVEVTDLANNHIVASDTQASGYTLATGGTFDITLGAETFTVTVNAGDNLTAVAQAINSSVSGGGVDFMDVAQASVVTDPVTGNQTLVLKSLETGTANAMSFADTANTVLLDIGVLMAGPAIKNQLQAADNADLIIDGLSISSSTNQVTGAIVGVTLNLVSSDPGNPVEVRIGPDDDSIVSQVKDFVSKFNEVTDYLGARILEKPVDNPKTVGDLQMGILQGDFDLIDAKSQLRTLLMTRNTGAGLPSEYSGDYTTDYDIAQEVGIDSVASSGSFVSAQIEVDESKLRSSLSANRAGVRAYLYEMADRLNDYLESETKVSVAQEFAGAIYQRVLGIDDRMKSIDDSIERMEDRVQAEEDRLRAQFQNLESALQQLQSQSSFLTAQLAGLSSSSQSSSKK